MTDDPAWTAAGYPVTDVVLSAWWRTRAGGTGHAAKHYKVPSGPIAGTLAMERIAADFHIEKLAHGWPGHNGAWWRYALDDLSAWWARLLW